MTKWIATGAVVGGVIGIPVGMVPSVYIAWMILWQFPTLGGVWLWGGCWFGCIALSAGIGAFLGYDVCRPV